MPSTERKESFCFHFGHAVGIKNFRPLYLNTLAVHREYLSGQYIVCNAKKLKQCRWRRMFQRPTRRPLFFLSVQTFDKLLGPSQQNLEQGTYTYLQSAR